jgi:hypothetical protein
MTTNGLIQKKSTVSDWRQFWRGCCTGESPPNERARNFYERDIEVEGWGTSEYR